MKERGKRDLILEHSPRGLMRLPQHQYILFAARHVPENLSSERDLHIDHLFAHMQRLKTYEAKRNAITATGSSACHGLPLALKCE